MSSSLQTAAFLIISSIVLIETVQCRFRYVSVVFRHGDRAPTNTGNELYPNDPHLNNNFHPITPGGLTNDGKQREYVLGQFLRDRYDEFLGNVYIPEDVVARCTNVDRTKMSLLLVLAGLYPPALVQRWNLALHWQPIPITYVYPPSDVLFTPHKCPGYIKELERVRSLPEVVSMVDKFRPLMNYLSEKMAKPIVDAKGMWHLYHSLMGEKSMDLALPEWSKDIFPDGELLRGTVLEYDIVSYDDLLKKLNGGTLLKRMSEDMVAIVEGKPVEARKINLFGGHETNIAALLHTLGVFKPHVPEYSSAVILELFEAGGEHYVRVVYYLGIPATIEELQIPGCDIFCPLNDFLNLLKKLTPKNEDLDCRQNMTAAAA